MKRVISVILIAAILLAMCPAAIASTEYKEYKVNLVVHCEANLILSRYDLDVYHRGKKIAHINHGEDLNTYFYAKEGSNILYFRKSDDTAINNYLSFDVSKDTRVKCDIHCYSDRVDIRDPKVIVLATQTTPTPAPDPTATPERTLKPSPSPSPTPGPWPLSLPNDVQLLDDIKTVKKKEGQASAAYGNDALTYKNRTVFTISQSSIYYRFDNRLLRGIVVDFEGRYIGLDVHKKYYTTVAAYLSDKFGKPSKSYERGLNKYSSGAYYEFCNNSGNSSNTEKAIDSIAQWEIEWIDGRKLIIEHLLGCYQEQNNKRYVHLLSFELEPMEFVENQLNENEEIPPASDSDQRTEAVSVSDSPQGNSLDEWICSNCGKTVTTKFCPDCGTPRHDEVMNNGEKTSESTAVYESKASDMGTPAPVSFSDIDLQSMSDQELESAAEMIRAEQRARIKIHIVLENKEMTLKVGETQKIEAGIEDLPEGMKLPKFEWSTSDNTVVTCDNGTIRAKKPGKAIITCSAMLEDGTKIASECTVTAKVPVSSISTGKKTVTLDANTMYSPTITIKPENATNKTLKYESSNSSVASVSSTGTIKGLKEGKATITISTTDGSGKILFIEVIVEDNRQSIGKRTAVITGSKTHGYLDIIDKYYSNYAYLLKDRYKSNLATLMICMILMHADKSIDIDFGHKSDVAFLGQSTSEKTKLFMALRSSNSKYTMVMIEPASNKVTYSKDKKTESEAKVFMKYNCGSYLTLTGDELADAYNTVSAYTE